jgi:hypothetical protein
MAAQLPPARDPKMPRPAAAAETSDRAPSKPSGERPPADCPAHRPAAGGQLQPLVSQRVGTSNPARPPVSLRTDDVPRRAAPRRETTKPAARPRRHDCRRERARRRAGLRPGAPSGRQPRPPARAAGPCIPRSPSTPTRCERGRATAPGPARPNAGPPRCEAKAVE